MRKWLCSVATLAMSLCVAQYWLVINTTPSLPRGLYLKTHGETRRGDIVLVCPPGWPVFQEALKRRFLSPGLCSSGMGALIKRVEALEGDLVRINDQHVTVNGRTLPNSARQDFGLDGLLFWDRPLAHAEVLLMTSHPRSFDARYFGPLDQSCVVTPLRPLWVKE